MLGPTDEQKRLYVPVADYDRKGTIHPVASETGD